jgi:metallo-beta-lactamase class B
MKAYCAGVLGVLLFVAGFLVPEARAQAAVEAHLAAAKAAAGEDYARMFENLCSVPAPPGERAARPYPPPASEWDAEPAKVFDNLYYVGSKTVGSWAVTTSEGIIIIDALFEYSVEEEIVNGLKKLGLDPAQIKYVILSHAHGDHYAGAPFLQDRLKVPILMGGPDWDYIASQRNPNKPRRDQVITDGQKLTLGDTTITMYLTPGHTPGTVSFLIPVRDGARRHLASMWGGTAFNVPRTAENFRIYGNSAQKFTEIVKSNPVDVVLTNHPDNSHVHEKIGMLRGRQDYEPHPFVVGKDSQLNHLTVANECAQAQMARIAAGGR